MKRSKAKISFLAGKISLVKEVKLNSRILQDKTKQAIELLAECQVCPRNCKNNRLKDEATGICKMGRHAVISSYHAHFGEERPLVGAAGSGTIFFASCSLRCIFCQNYDISHFQQGRKVSAEELADIMIDLQERGCHNINLVTPTHFAPQILEALSIANENGLNIPIVYNTSGYDSVRVLKILEGVIDIYMPDFKFIDAEMAKKLAKAPDYPEVAKKAVKEMHNQVGDLVIDKGRLAVKGLLLRHLVMPNNLANTKEVLNFVASNISKNTYLNIMDQYHPCYKAIDEPSLNRRITPEEYTEALDYSHHVGLRRLFA